MPTNRKKSGRGGVTKPTRPGRNARNAVLQTLKKTSREAEVDLLDKQTAQALEKFENGNSERDVCGQAINHAQATATDADALFGFQNVNGLSNDDEKRTRMLQNALILVLYLKKAMGLGIEGAPEARKVTLKAAQIYFDDQGVDAMLEGLDANDSLPPVRMVNGILETEDEIMNAGGEDGDVSMGDSDDNQPTDPSNLNENTTYKQINEEDRAFWSAIHNKMSQWIGKLKEDTTSIAVVGKICQSNDQIEAYNRQHNLNPVYGTMDLDFFQDYYRNAKDMCRQLQANRKNVNLLSRAAILTTQAKKIIDNLALPQSWTYDIAGLANVSLPENIAKEHYIHSEIFGGERYVLDGWTHVGDSNGRRLLFKPPKGSRRPHILYARYHFGKTYYHYCSQAKECIPRGQATMLKDGAQPDIDYVAIVLTDNDRNINAPASREYIMTINGNRYLFDWKVLETVCPDLVEKEAKCIAQHKHNLPLLKTRNPSTRKSVLQDKVAQLTQLLAASMLRESQPQFYPPVTVAPVSSSVPSPAVTATAPTTSSPQLSAKQVRQLQAAQATIASLNPTMGSFPWVGPHYSTSAVHAH